MVLMENMVLGDASCVDVRTARGPMFMLWWGPCQLRCLLLSYSGATCDATYVCHPSDGDMELARLPADVGSFLPPLRCRPWGD